MAVFAAAAAIVGRGTRHAGGVRCGGRRLRDRVLPRPRLHLVLFAIADRDDPELRRAVLRWAPGAFLGPSLLVGASFFDGSADLALWAAALAVDYLSPQVGHGQGWRLSPAHFVERHGLIMIVALGESIVTIGVGAAGLPLDAPRIAAALFGMLVAASLWWLYLDWVIYVSQAKLTERHRCGAGDARARPVHVPPHAYRHMAPGDETEAVRGSSP